MKTPEWFENYHSLLESQHRHTNDSICSIKADIKNLKENHLAHLQDELTVVSTNQKWLMSSVKKWDARFWAMLAGIAGTLITTILTLIFK